MDKYSRSLAPLINQTSPKPKLELTPDQIRQISKAGDILLAIIGITGMALVSIAAPNAVQAFKFLGNPEQRIPFEERKKRVARSFYYLKSKGYVDFQRYKNDFKIEMTDKGKKKIDQIKLQVLKVKKPLIWDRKFWQVAADIPIKYRKGADALRNKLKTMGFYSLQRTLWFYPYDPRKEIEILAEEYKIDRFVTVMKIAKLDLADSKVLRDYFKETGVVEF